MEKLHARFAQEAKLAEVARVLGNVSREVKNLLMPIVTGTGVLQEQLKTIFAFIPRQGADKLRASKKLCEKIGGMLQRATNLPHEHVQKIADRVKNLSSAPAFFPRHLAAVAMDVAGTLSPVQFEERSVP